MDALTVDQLGDEIYAAEQAAAPIAPPSERFGDLDPADAYCIQERYATRRVAAGARLVGRKIGCTSRAIQDFFGIDTPDYGHLFADMRILDGGELDHAELIAPMVEPEIVFVLENDVRGPGLGAAEVLAATRAVGPALEIIDSRIRDWRIAFVDTVADNGSSARFVVGAMTSPYGFEELAAEGVRLREDSAEFDSGTGAAVLGNPANSVAWLANSLAQFGHHLRAGDYVLSGSITRAVPVAAGKTYTAEFDTLGSVSCRFR